MSYNDITYKFQCGDLVSHFFESDIFYIYLSSEEKYDRCKVYDIISEVIKNEYEDDLILEVKIKE